MRTNNNTIIITGADLSPGHEYEIVVQAVSSQGLLQSPDDSPRNVIKIMGKETNPSQPSGLTALGGLVKISLFWDDQTDKDFDVMEIWRSLYDDVSLGAKIAETKSTTFTDNIGSTGQTRYYWIRARNTSGKTSRFYPEGVDPGVSATTTGITPTEIDDFSVTATKIFANTIILTGDAWTNNSPVAGSIAWNEHYLVYGGAYYKVAASNTALRYVYWDVGNTGGTGTVADPYLTTYTKNAAYAHATNRFTIVTNEAGVVQKVWNASANMVIGSAFILNAAITEAKIDNLAVTTGKIAALAVTDAKIDTLAVSKLTSGTIRSKNIVLDVTEGGGSVEIRAGIDLDDWANVGAKKGFILGVDDLDGNKPKFYIGDANTYLNWNGAALAIKGSLTITGGSGIASLTDAGDLSVLDVIGSAYITDLSVSKLTAGTISSQSIVLGITEGTGDVEIRAGIATGDFANAGAAAGFIIGLDDSDSDKPKVYIGDATKYLKWDGAALTVRGTLNADDISAGTLTGRTIQTASGTGKRTVLDSSDNTLRFYNSSNVNVVYLNDDTLYTGSPELVMSSATGGMIYVGKDINNSILIESLPTVGIYPATANLVITSEGYGTAGAILEIIGGFSLTGNMLKTNGKDGDFAVNEDGDVTIDGVYSVGANQVVGARGAAVADALTPVGTPTNPGIGFATPQEMSDFIAYTQTIKTAVNTLLARCRAHGLIAT